MNMKEFTIIKCTSCDAPLVELEGEKLTSCIQCGYVFSSAKQTDIDTKAITTSKKDPSLILTFIKWYTIIALIVGFLIGLFSL
ncbi:hypothetical protein MNBD_GAMMA01-860 [hydrothermal vent metagenome]|uniref:Uncharacterized protein n=1 Tax=hydrothermal vent metagenome TaxID=652676 RepID=A0A3B0W5N9_9ZZZZ